MYIHDDADMVEVVQTTVSALKESARHVGKADRSITETQVLEIRKAIAELENALRFKQVTKG